MIVRTDTTTEDGKRIITTTYDDGTTWSWIPMPPFETVTIKKEDKEIGICDE